MNSPYTSTKKVTNDVSDRTTSDDGEVKMNVTRKEILGSIHDGSIEFIVGL